MECKLTPAQVIKVAAAADVDPRTVRRYIAGEGGYSRTADRIAKALQELGIENPRPKEA